MSFSETIFLFFLALIIFGPKKLPEIARQVAKYMNEFKRASNEFKSQIEQEIANLEIEERRRKILPSATAPEGTASRMPNAAPSEPSPAASPYPAGAAETTPHQGQATADDDEPLFAATAAALPTEPAAVTKPSASEAVTSAASQEPHA